jgi:hypothetical protein
MLASPTVRLMRRLLRPGLVCAFIVIFGLMPLFYVEPLLGRRLPASMEMLYTLVIIHIGLFVIRTK